MCDIYIYVYTYTNIYMCLWVTLLYKYNTFVDLMNRNEQVWVWVRKKTPVTLPRHWQPDALKLLLLSQEICLRCRPRFWNSDGYESKPWHSRYDKIDGFHGKVVTHPQMLSILGCF